MSTYPTAFDATFPGYPYVDNTQFVDQTQANAWVQSIQAIQTAIGYGSPGTPQNPLYSQAYATTYSTITARIAALETTVATGLKLNSSNATIQPVGSVNLAGASGLAADAGHVHAGPPASQLVQIGTIFLWPGAAATFPTNCLLCNGQLISTSTYATLFGIIAYNYGGGGASFALPNFNDRFPIGPNTTAAGVGITGGSRTISGAQLPQHNHGINVSLSDPGHRHESQLDEVPGDEGVYTSGGSTLSLQIATAGPPNAVSYSPTGGGQLHWKSATTGVGVSSATSNNAGSSTPYDQPFIGMNFLIRAL